MNWNKTVMIHLTEEELPENFEAMLKEFIANSVKTSASLCVSSDKDQVGTIEIIEGSDPHYRCEKCGGDRVEHSHWVGLNDGVVNDVFGSWCNGDNSYCADCNENTKIIDKSDQEDEAWDEYENGGAA